MAGMNGNGRGGQFDFVAALDVALGGEADVDKPHARSLDEMVQAYKPMAQDVETRLVRAAQAGDVRARDRLLANNMGFIITTIMGFCREGQDWRELVGVGVEGFCEAIKRFDADRGVRLISYAVWWVKNSLRRALAEGWLVKQPANWVDVRRDIWARATSTGETFAQAGAALGVSKRIMANLNQSVEGLDAPIAGDDDRTRADVRPDDRVVGMDDLHEQAQTGAVVREVLETLDDRERDIIARRYGFDGGEGEVTMQMVGDEWGLSRERVRQIEGAALESLKKRLRHRGVGHAHLAVFAATAGAG